MGRKKVRELITAFFNNMQTLEFKAPPTNVIFATANQMFGGSSQLSSTADLRLVQYFM